MKYTHVIPVRASRPKVWTDTDIELGRVLTRREKRQLKFAAYNAKKARQENGNIQRSLSSYQNFVRRSLR